MRTTSNRLSSLAAADGGSRADTRPLAQRSGFTLVELLVVIAIIGILAALITPALSNVMWAARQTKIKVETDQLASALEAYKAKYGSYPPSNLNIAGDINAQQYLMAHLARVFPRYIYNGNISQITTDISTATTLLYPADTQHFNPANALLFWLQGFSPDVTNPFNGQGTRTPLFDLDKTRITADANGFYTYYAPYGSTPYVYFSSSDYYSTYPAAGNQLLANPRTYTTPSAGIVAPYVLDVDNNAQIDGPAPNPSPNGPDTFAKPNSFQIISAGQDGQFGAGTSTRLFPTGVGYDSTGADDDNVTNFNEKNNLGDAKP
jgi:prepilin-type N-terminal cleavage/methylation domain-containing protein